VFVLMAEGYEDAAVVGVFTTRDAAIASLPSALHPTGDADDYWTIDRSHRNIGDHEHVDWEAGRAALAGHIAVGIRLEEHEMQP
jgi:hypothetical protein